MLIETLMDRMEWFNKIMRLPSDQSRDLSSKATSYRTTQLLCDLRAQLAIVDFERNMYKLPEHDRTETNLNRLWWEMQEKYLFEQKPENRDNPDWARVPHYAGLPAYYHNYFLAGIRRSQVFAHIKQNFGSLLTQEARDYLKAHRKSGLTYKWFDTVQRMTNKPLQAEALVSELNDSRR